MEPREKVWRATELLTAQALKRGLREDVARAEELN